MDVRGYPVKALVPWATFQADFISTHLHRRRLQRKAIGWSYDNINLMLIYHLVHFFLSSSVFTTWRFFVVSSSHIDISYAFSKPFWLGQKTDMCQHRCFTNKRKNMSPSANSFSMLAFLNSMISQEFKNRHTTFEVLILCSLFPETSPRTFGESRQSSMSTNPTEIPSQLFCIASTRDGLSRSVCCNKMSK
jgi:hypothetical protein